MRISALLLILACWTAFAGPAPEQPTPWQANATRYLDDRIDIWFVKAKKLRTGDTPTSCVSCHTVAPYALARPALRKAGGVKAPAPQEERLLRETLLRVATYASSPSDLEDYFNSGILSLAAAGNTKSILFSLASALTGCGCSSTLFWPRSALFLHFIPRPPDF
jgi:hypothetical protein